MANYKAVTRFKLGPDKDGNERGYKERGDNISVSGDDAERLLASGSILSASDFKVQFPGFDEDDEEGGNQPAGTPSNLEQIEGTKLQQNQPPEPKDGDKGQQTPPPNPADVPTVKGANTPGS